VIFYRTNFQSRIFEDMLLKVKIPYVIIGGVSFYQRREIKDILSLLRIVLAGADFIALSRTINIPKRGLGEKALEKVREGAIAAGISLWDFCVAISDRRVECKLSPKQMEGMRSYVTLILALKEMVLQKVPLQTLVAEAIERSLYENYLKEDPETYAERKGNIAELVTKAAEWEQENPSGTLAGFLEELTLKTSSDAKEPLSDSVKLMTLHNGKGLEFSVVFLVGMEEDLFPHVNTLDSETALEEERRLCYVGMTRAKAHLYLTAAKYRFLWGGGRTMRPSRFLAEVPSEYIYELTPKPRPARDTAALQVKDVVHHRDFGLGVIQKQYETSLGLTYDVFFSEDRSIRSLVAKYAKLVKSSDDSAS
jgi:DNA helicase-2/ATP-dependent DNA helicase PcrA